VLSKVNKQIEDPAHMGHMMFIVSKVAKQLNLIEGYRVVVNQSDTWKHVKSSMSNNLFIHVIGGE
jgi:hypothetical protein